MIKETTNMMEDNGNVTGKRKGKEKTSVVWAHFTVLEEDRPTVMCVHCKKTFYLCQGSTSSMLNHLKAQHPTELDHTDGHKSQSEQLLDVHADEHKTSPIKERKGKRSIVWLHFTRSGRDTVDCLYCKKRLKYQSGSTTNMHKHLHQHHPYVNNTKGHQETTMVVQKNVTTCIRKSRTRSVEKVSLRTKQQPLVVKGASESQERDVESSESVDAHPVASQLLQLQVHALLKQLEEKERQLTQAYETFQNTVRGLSEDMESIQEQLTHLNGKYQGAKKGRPCSSVKSNSQVPTAVPSTVRHTRSIEYEACEGRPLLTLSCTSEPNSPGFDETEGSPQRSSKDQEVTIIGLLTPSSTAVANSDSILEFVNTFMQTAYTSEASATTAAGSGSDTERQPVHLPLKTLSVRLQDCRHKLGPDGIFTVQSVKMHGRQEDRDFEDEDDYDNDDDGGDDDVSDYNHESDPDYRPEDDGNSDKNPEKFFQRFCKKKRSQQGSSQRAMQHPEKASPPQKASLKVHGGSSSEERPFKCPLCGKSYKYCPDYIQHLKTHSSPTFTPHGQQEREDDNDDDHINTEKDPENNLENGGNSYDRPKNDLGRHKEAEEEMYNNDDDDDDEIDGDGNKVANGKDTNYNLEDDCNSNDNPEDEALQSSSNDGNNISFKDNMGNKIGDATVYQCL
ncbi:uncharacterized protein LOC121718268 isoform X2 [Alosa sapidissima]|uniref:uncharacterized protein LOC121718268 isoform X2 n=1 Tax=Alosa sapidissima TaxID=34773 RepID=UPI001C0861E7|nr:uncharacterized protein LOC121718268 isoform X2 [Alosa sapidissima]